MLSQRQTTIKNMILNRYLFEPWIKYRRRQHWTLYKLFVCNLYQPNVSMVNSESRKDNLEYRDGMPEKMTWINSLAIQMFGTMHTALPFMFIAKKTILPDHVWNSEFQQQVHQIYNIFIALDYIRKKWSAVVGSDNLRYTNSKKMHEFRYFYPQPITDFFLNTTYYYLSSCFHLQAKVALTLRPKEQCSSTTFPIRQLFVNSSCWCLVLWRKATNFNLLQVYKVFLQ